ncbi:MAG: cytochrome c-type biogenesis protein [Haloechinothrix sp.]
MSSRVGNALSAATIITLLAVALVGLFTAEVAPEDRAYALEQRLRCPVCKSVSIAESPSETAASMRLVVAEQVAAGRSDAEIIGYFQDRYGPWVLLDPPVAGRTKWLWFLAIAGVGAGLAAVLLRFRTKSPQSAPLSQADQDRLSAAIGSYRKQRNEWDDEP